MASDFYGRLKVEVVASERILPLPDYSIASIVDWYGPYRKAKNLSVLQVARKAAKDYYVEKGLYCAIGHGAEVRRGPHTMLYMGLGTLVNRLCSRHHKLEGLSVASIWLGEVAVKGLPGRRSKKTSPHLDTVEWASAYFLNLPWNQKKTVNPSNTSCVVLNRWWKPIETVAGMESEPSSRPVKGWADLIEWNSETNVANLCWFGSAGYVKQIDRDRHPV